MLARICLSLVCWFYACVVLASWPVIDFSNLAQLGKQMSQLQKQYRQLEQQYKLLSETKKLSYGQLSAITGNMGHGKNDFFSYTKALGTGTENWAKVLDSYQNGSGPLATLAKQYQAEYPIEHDLVNSAVQNSREQKYYTLQAKTAIASRATSNAVFNNIETKLARQEKLINNIDNEKSLKGSVELLSRLQAENNLIQLEMMRLMAMLNQQQAVNAQGQVNSALTNAQFLGTDY